MSDVFEINNGIFSALFLNGDFRKLKTGGQEFIQRIYFAVRDEQWRNVSFALKKISEQSSNEAFSCTHEMLFSAGSIKFNVNIFFSIEKNNITIEANGKALCAFNKNRIGFCLHLPATLKATDCIVTHLDHTTTVSSFPFFVSPHQPFKNISAIEWEKNGKRIKIVLEGDVFEMEDQRNWTDASYKIYSTPLEIPFPAEVKKGEKFYQKISIMLSGEKQSDPINNKLETLPSETVACPALGIVEPGVIAGGENILSEKSDLPFSHYRIDFHLYDTNWKTSSLPGILRAAALHLPVYAVVYFSGNFLLQAKEFIAFIHSFKSVFIHSVCLLPAENFVLRDDVLQALVSVMRQSFSKAAVGGGTDANFAQLNRSRPDPSLLDFICYSVQPQEHAADALSIIENIQGQLPTVQTAKTFSANKEVHISALSFFKRFNANVTSVWKDKIETYEHKGSCFEAAWFVASLHQLIVAGAACINCVYPVKKELPLIKMVSYMAKNPPERFYTCGSFLPEKYAALSWRSKNKRHSVFANLTEEKIAIAHPFAEIVLMPFEIHYTSSILKNQFHHL